MRNINTGTVLAAALALGVATSAYAATGEFGNMCAEGLAQHKQIKTDCSISGSYQGKTTPLEQMVHQCVSEDTWFKNMLAISIPLPVLPPEESRLAFLHHYAEASAQRLARLLEMPERWFEETTRFFDTQRTRAWVLTRRIAHSAHHRGQLTTYLRCLGYELYSTYGPTADTGGLFQNRAEVIYRYPSLERLLEAEGNGGDHPALPGPGPKNPTERPDTPST